MATERPIDGQHFQSPRLPGGRDRGIGVQAVGSRLDRVIHGSRQHLPDLIVLHDVAAETQRRLLSSYPGHPDSLPMPLREDPLYYDGSQFYMRKVDETLRKGGRESLLTADQQTWVVSTMGVNDWWMDESGWAADGSRDYDTVIDAFNGINAICYSHLRPDESRAPITSPNPEVQRLIDYHDHVLRQLPEGYRPSIAKSLIATNLYQSVTLYQEEGYRDYMGLGNIENTEANRQMLERMQIEKGGFMFTYFWPYFPDIVDGITIPNEPPTIQDTLQLFLDGHSIYPADGLGRLMLEMGGVNQLMDDICDAIKDGARGVVSPQNLGVVYDEVSTGNLVEVVFRELDALRGPDDADYNLVLDAGDNAVAGASVYRTHKLKL